MSLTEFIYQELLGDGTLDDESYSAEDITRDFLNQETELGEEEVEDLISQYYEYCNNEGITPDNDLD